MVRSKRLSLAGHCHRHPMLPASRVMLREPKHGKPSRGRPIKTMVKMMEDAGVEMTDELVSCMNIRDVWRVLHHARLKQPLGSTG